MKPWHQHRAESMSDKASPQLYPDSMEVDAQTIASLRAQLAAAEAETKRWEGVAEFAGARILNLNADLASARKALEDILVDPPSTLDEPDTDAEVITKIRAIARAALKPDEALEVLTPEALAEHRSVHLQVGRPTVTHPDGGEE